MKKMPQVSVFMHKSVHDWCDYVADVRNTSRSEVVEDMVKHIRDNDLEDDVWEDFTDDEKDYLETLEGTPEDVSEEETDE